jgi:hypothetical protein
MTERNRGQSTFALPAEVIHLESDGQCPVWCGRYVCLAARKCHPLSRSALRHRGFLAPNDIRGYDMNTVRNTTGLRMLAYPPSSDWL